MFKTEQEIFGQYHSLRKTYNYMLKRKDEIRSYLSDKFYRSLTFIGCGSSYSLCKSAEASYKIKSGLLANSLAAGDLLVNYADYEKLVKGTLLIIPSRSGSTSEVVMATKRMAEEMNVPCISICARENSELSRIAGLSLELPWAFDESVCQTSTVTNLYLANLLLIGIILDDSLLLRELDDAIGRGNSYIEQVKAVPANIVAGGAWEKVVVLADSELAGIAEEGALAFNEICRLNSNYYHVLDVRHGPMVLVDHTTLAIVACSPHDTSYQKGLISDLKAHGAVVVTISSSLEEEWGSDYNFVIPACKNYGVLGIPFILIPQLLSFYKALKKGVNPDLPEGLDPWIKL